MEGQLINIYHHKVKDSYRESELKLQEEFSKLDGFKKEWFNEEMFFELWDEYKDSDPTKAEYKLRIRRP